MKSTDSISRSIATDVPLSPLSPIELDRLVDIEAFSGLDTKFRQSETFRKIISINTRFLTCDDGDIVIRKGDWGNSAFFIVSGTVAIDLEEGVPGEILGRPRSQRKGLFQALAQLWTNHRTAEYRDINTYRDLAGVGKRVAGQETRMFLLDVPAVIQKHRTREMSEGQFFGELGALGRTARTATVISKGKTVLLEMRWQGLRDLMRRDQGFRKSIDDLFRKHALLDLLRNSPIFQHLKDNDAVMAELGAGAQLRTYGDYDKVGSYKKLASRTAAGEFADAPLIAAEGDHPNGVILIRNGLARVSRKHHNGNITVSYLGPGQVYGLEEIDQGFRANAPVPLQNSLHALGFLTTIELPTPLIEERLLEPSAKSEARQRIPISKISGTDTSRLPPEFVEFLVERRFVNGTETMLIDLNRCTRCDDCVRACASAHDNNPRFVRQGPVNHNIMVAHACMHCQDPVCMIECPTGAISRRQEDGIVVINDLTCIGCATCANNCPYNAIRMVEIRHADGSFVRDTTTRDPIPKATKCDLCVDQVGGPACQRACPHDALVRIGMSNGHDLTAWLNR